jgi:hypothetical protein
MSLILLCFVFFNFVATVALIVSSFKLWVEIKAMQKSTHQIVMPTAYAPNPTDFAVKDDAAKESVDKSFSDYIGIN